MIIKMIIKILDEGKRFLDVRDDVITATMQIIKEYCLEKILFMIWNAYYLDIQKFKKVLNILMEYGNNG